MMKDLVEYLSKNDVKEEDAYLISKISNNAEKNLQIVKSEYFETIKNVLKESLTYLASKRDYFIVYFQIEGIKQFNNDEEIDLYLDMLEICLMEAIIKKEDSTHTSFFFDELITKISNKYDHIDHMINDITKAKIDLLSNANKNLVFDKLLINLLRR